MNGIGGNRLGGAVTPWHLWVVGALTLLWNAFGCYIYTLTMLRDPALMSQTPPEMIALLDNSPAWADGAWAVGVWAALAGSLLLLLRNRAAVWAFAVSLLGLAGTAIYELLYSVPVNAIQVMVIWAVALFLLWYALKMRREGALR